MSGKWKPAEPVMVAMEQADGLVFTFRERWFILESDDADCTVDTPLGGTWLLISFTLPDGRKIQRRLDIKSMAEKMFAEVLAERDR